MNCGKPFPFKGNPQPSPKRNQREGSETKRPRPKIQLDHGHEIVQALRQLEGTCNEMVVGSSPTGGADLRFWGLSPGSQSFFR